MTDWLASLNWGGSMTPLGLAIVLVLLVIVIVIRWVQPP
jgi:hypothetical protein